MRLALRTQTPIVPVAVVGAEEQYLSFGNIEWAARALGLPAFPVENQAHRSEEHTSELQSHSDLVCRLLLEKKKKKTKLKTHAWLILRDLLRKNHRKT